MAVDIKLKRSHTHSNIPTTSDLAEGEFAVNTYDRKLYMRDGSNEIVTVGNHYATDYESATKILYVTVATSTTDHPYHSTGSSNKYKINGIFSPYLHLIPRNTYRFDQSDSSNSGHPLRFYLDVDKNTAYTTGVTTSGTPGSSGAYTQIVVSDSTPPVLHYQCSAHANMGWAAFTNTRNLTNFDTDDLSEGSSNLYYTDARVQAVSINNVVEDTTPQLGGNLDNNDKNITFGDSSSPGTDNTLILGDSNDLRIYHNGTHSFIHDNGTGQLRVRTNEFRVLNANNNETLLNAVQNGEVNLYHNNAIKLSTTSTGIQVKSVDTSSSAGPIIDLVRDSSSPADADYLGQIRFKGDDDGGSSTNYAMISGKIGDASAGSEDGVIEFNTFKGGSGNIVARMNSNGLILNTAMTLRFEGATADAHETTLTVADPTADRTITLPNSSGTVALTSDITSSDVVDDTSPQLGGNLDVNGNAIVSASNGNIAITPNGSGSVIIDGLSHPQADGNAGQVLKTDGSGQLAFASVSSLAGAGIQNVSDDSSPQLGGNLDVVTHNIISTSNRNISLLPNGSGKVVVGTNGIQFGDGTTQTSAGASTGFAIAMGVALG